MVNRVYITHEPESLSHDCAENGRYSNVSDVVQSGPQLSQHTEDGGAQFQVMLQTAQADADRDGTVSIESVLMEVDAIINASDPMPATTRSQSMNHDNGSEGGI